ncbi:uncharacterized protein LOC143187654 [Calliopsis andreniformis]|uniref:uncharacterized protein LOC143187654 n=1 Tax=Calliopsis andreniformis TaxID=337506 RepID=UPI003FCC5475
MNDLSTINSKTCNDSDYSFSIPSLLYIWIKTLECILHIAYNLLFKKWTEYSPTFFASAVLSAEISGIDVTLIKKLRVILKVISFPCEINANKFQQYTRETAEYFVNYYNRYYMPSFIYKILIHGAEIDMHCFQRKLSEEALKNSKCVPTKDIHTNFKYIREKT